MERRHFMKLAGACGMSAMFLPRWARAAEPICTDQFWVSVFAKGAWDPTSIMDPKGKVGVKGPINSYQEGDIGQAGNLLYAPVGKNNVAALQNQGREVGVCVDVAGRHLHARVTEESLNEFGRPSSRARTLKMSGSPHWTRTLCKTVNRSSRKLLWFNIWSWRVLRHPLPQTPESETRCRLLILSQASLLEPGT